MGAVLLRVARDKLRENEAGGLDCEHWRGFVERLDVDFGSVQFRPLPSMRSRQKPEERASGTQAAVD